MVNRIVAVVVNHTIAGDPMSNMPWLNIPLIEVLPSEEGDEPIGTQLFLLIRTPVGSGRRRCLAIRS
jgi:hypothetical protein